MRADNHFLRDEFALVVHDSGVRTGVYVGIGLAISFTLWLYVANRMPGLERVARDRNIIGAALVGAFFLVPVLRFMWQPGRLLVSSLIAWSVFAFAYRGLSLHFHGLGERYSAVQVFTLGAIVYMILATLSWIGTCVWRVRESYMSDHRISHSNHHL
jgi:hypothetical protein